MGRPKWARKARTTRLLPKLNLEVQISRLCTKQPHAANEDAVAELARLLERGGRLEDFNLYQCTICNGAWHIGHRVPSQERVRLPRQRSEE